MMRHGDRTGFYMNAHEPVSTFVAWTYRECMIEENSLAHALKRGMNRCNILFGDILERPDHGGSPIAKGPHLGFRSLRFHLTRDPQLLAVPLGLAAQHRLLNKPGVVAKDHSLDEVKRLGSLVCNLWRPKNPNIRGGLGGQGLAGLHPEDSYFDANWAKYLRNANKRLEWEAILVRSFEDAAEVLARENELPLARQLARIAEVIRAEAEIDRTASIISEKTVGHYMWQKLVEEPLKSNHYRESSQWKPSEKVRAALRQGGQLHPLDRQESALKDQVIENHINAVTEDTRMAAQLGMREMI